MGHVIVTDELTNTLSYGNIFDFVFIFVVFIFFIILCIFALMKDMKNFKEDKEDDVKILNDIDKKKILYQRLQTKVLNIIIAMLFFIYTIFAIISGFKQVENLNTTQNTNSISDNCLETVETEENSTIAQQISEYYNTCYIKYEDGYHGMFDSKNTFDDESLTAIDEHMLAIEKANEYVKLYPPENYCNIVARYCMENYPNEDVGNIKVNDIGSNLDLIHTYHYLSDGIFYYNYGVAYRYLCGKRVFLYDPVNDKVLEAFDDQLSFRLCKELNIYGIGQGKIQGEMLIEKCPFMYDYEFDEYANAYRQGMYMASDGLENNNFVYVDVNSTVDELLDFVCAVSTDRDNKTDNYYVDGGSAFFIISDNELNIYDDSCLFDFVEIVEEKTENYYNNGKHFVCNIYIFSPLTVDYEFIYNTEVKMCFTY